MISPKLFADLLQFDMIQISSDGTKKRAYELHDGQLIESVLMPYEGLGNKTIFMNRTFEKPFSNLRWKADCMYFQSSWLWNGLCILCYWPNGLLTTAYFY